MAIRALIILIVISLTFIVAILHFKKCKSKPIKYFAYFIGYVFTSETISNFFLFNGLTTQYFNNIYSICYTLFFLFFYSMLIEKIRNKRIVYAMMLIFVISTIINQLYFQKFEIELHTYTFILGLFLVTIAIFIYFIEIMGSDKIMNLAILSEFWISIGVLIFNLGLIPVLVVAEFIGWSGVYNYILLAINIIMYGCFIIGFIVCNKDYNI